MVLVMDADPPVAEPVSVIVAEPVSVVVMLMDFVARAVRLV